jgi:glutamyl-tRNA reductase
MSVLVVGLSHKSAPVATLERAVLTGDSLGKLLHDVFHSPDVAGAFVVSTCNRVEVYAEVDKFHGGVSAISELLARHAGVPLSELTPHLYVHYEDRAIQHLLSVACGLDSMVIGESQILGQVRKALRIAGEQATLGRALSDLGSAALRAGKRAHTETGIDRAGASLVSVGLAAAAERLGATPDGAVPDGATPDGATPDGATPDATTSDGAVPDGAVADGPVPGGAVPGAGAGVLAGRAVLVVGAGSMSSLTVATAARMGADRIVVANRSAARAQRLAATAPASVSATTADLSRLPEAIAAADLVVSCTGAPGHVITVNDVATALASLPRPGRPLVLLDLAMPRDVEPAAGALDGVSVISLGAVGEASQGDGARSPDGGISDGDVTSYNGVSYNSVFDGGLSYSGVSDGGGSRLGLAHEDDVAAVRRIVAEELAARVSADRAARVAPTVVALRAKAAEVVQAELTRLEGRVGGLDTRARREIAQSMRRIADKLLHAPTVRVKELAGSPGGDSYEAVLRVLFDLDPDAVQAVTRADAVAPGWPEQEVPK